MSGILALCSLHYKGIVGISPLLGGRQTATEAVGRGLGVGEAAPPPRTQQESPTHGGAFPAEALCVFRHVFDVLANITELVVQILSVRLNLVFDFG